DFAGSTQAKTLFSCRVTDFSPRFLHKRLVILPFDRDQIDQFLRKYVPTFPIRVDGRLWRRQQLARHIAAGGLPVEPNNPFVLWLLCQYIRNKKTWPASRVQLLSLYARTNYGRKAEEAREAGLAPFPDLDAALAAWAHFAYTITTRNRGPSIDVQLLGCD